MEDSGSGSGEWIEEGRGVPDVGMSDVGRAGRDQEI